MVWKLRKHLVHKWIDQVLHPSFGKHHGKAVVADGILHFLVEDNLEMSIRKFARYNLKPLLEAVEDR